MVRLKRRKAGESEPGGTDVCFYFQVHQPMRIRRLQAFRRPERYDYWDAAKDREILDRASRKCYLPANRLILDLIEQTEGSFRVAYSLSGVFLDQIERHRPDVLESFQALARTGHVEFLAETYYHSLCGLWDDPTEHKEQIEAHRKTIRRLFGQTPTVFRNTELIYDDRIAATARDLGFDAIITEGTEKILGDRSPNRVYRPVGMSGPKVLLKNYRLSDDIAFRFSTPGWNEAPLTADKYAHWLSTTPGDTINLFMDYETFGEHQWPETGIFEFLRHLPNEAARYPHLRFALPSEVAADHGPVDELHVPHAISWADTERDVSAWLHNKMQHMCFERLKALAPTVRAAGDPELMHAWRLLQTSDHLYYCSTKSLDDQDIHNYFSPYDSPYIAFINYTNAIDDLEAKSRGLVEERPSDGSHDPPPAPMSMA
ncbi:MAG: glycoside hydrolase family 57 protein [Euryarchaeota archaeon]|nr:glycoside hydrolase family 57 protein [Euryarchaeota archaeon]